MANINRKISTNDTLIQMINKFNSLVDFVYGVDEKIGTVYRMLIDQQKNETKPDENEKENSHDRFNYLMECASEIKKECLKYDYCPECPLCNKNGDCVVKEGIPELWNLTKGGE